MDESNVTACSVVLNYACGGILLSKKNKKKTMRQKENFGSVTNEFKISIIIQV